MTNQLHQPHRPLNYNGEIQMKLLKILAIASCFISNVSMATITSAYQLIGPNLKVVNCLANSDIPASNIAQQVIDLTEYITTKGPLNHLSKIFGASCADLFVAEQSRDAFKSEDNFIPRIVDVLKSKNVDTQLVAFPDPEEYGLDYWNSDTIETEANKIRQMYGNIEKSIPATLLSGFYDVYNSFEAHISTFKGIENETEKELWIDNYNQLSHSLFGFKLLTQLLQATDNKKYSRIHICAHEKQIECVKNLLKKLEQDKTITIIPSGSTYNKHNDNDKKLQQFIGKDIQLPKRSLRTLNYSLTYFENSMITQISNLCSSEKNGEQNENN